MDAENQQTIESKLEYLNAQIRSLQQFLPNTRRDYSGNRLTQLAVERLCQVVVECAIDVNLILAQELEDVTPQTGREGFEVISSHGVISQYIHNRFNRHYVGFRNRIVHIYDKINPTTAYYTAKRLIHDTIRYAGEIRKYLDSLEAAAQLSPAADKPARHKPNP